MPKIPLFLEEGNWCVFDEEAFEYKLKEGAPQYIVDSYNDYIKNGMDDGDQIQEGY